jgi:hypothetical protein
MVKGTYRLKRADAVNSSFTSWTLKLPCSLKLDIIYSQKNKFGLQFISEDIETASHLRRLLELNIDSEVIDKKVDFWLKEN